MIRPSHISAADWADISIHLPERDGPVLLDGQSMRVNLTLMDSMDAMQRTIIHDIANRPAIVHRPGAVASASTSNALAAAYEKRDKAMADAWRSPPPQPAAAAPTTPAPAPFAIDTSAPDWREQMYAARDAALRAAWQEGATA